MYTLLEAVQDTRILLNDTTESVWTNKQITYYLNEAISIVKKTVPEHFELLTHVQADNDEIYIDEYYKMLLPLFASARCFDQDEQHYRSTQKMNEFEIRRVEMETDILNNLDESEEEIAERANKNDYVIDTYYQ